MRFNSTFRALSATFIVLLCTLFAAPLSAQAQEKEAYVVQSIDETTLTFYYDANIDDREGTVFPIDETQTDEEGGYGYPVWAGTSKEANTWVKKAKFDASFKDYLPTSIGSWFYNCQALETIEGLENINTSNVEEAFSMFVNCVSLKVLDLSSWDMSKVTDIAEMFYNCSALTTIYCDSEWNCETSTDMFTGCTSLKGAVAYDATQTNVSMANHEGYFTKVPTALSRTFLNARKAKGIYTLQGKRVDGKLQHLPAGVYIVNGVLEIRN